MKGLFARSAPVPPVPVSSMTAALHDVLKERRRQVLVEGFHAVHDDLHAGGEIARAAANYAAAAAIATTLGGKGYDSSPPMANFGAAVDWPWDVSWWKPGTARRMLVKACALILAEIERLDRRDEREAS